jgi:hypothetical protein
MMVYLYATNVIKLAISLVTAKQEACNISPHKVPIIIHMFVPACNISVKIHISTTHISVLGCHISPHRDPSIIHLFVLMLLYIQSTKTYWYDERVPSRVGKLMAFF